MTVGDKEFANQIVDLIIYDLSDRRGLSGEWGRIDEDIIEEIKETWANIIVEALAARDATEKTL